MRFLLFQGTMDRSDYWTVTVALLIARGATAVIPDPLIDFIVSIPVAWLGLCVIAARLRDAGSSAWLVLAFFAPLPLVFVNPGWVIVSAVALLPFYVVIGLVPTRASTGDMAAPTRRRLDMAVLIITVTYFVVTYFLGAHMPPAKITWLVLPGVLYPLPFVIWLSPGLGLFLMIYSRRSRDTR